MPRKTGRPPETSTAAASPGFNEAAARCRGKHAAARTGRARTSCFNEAAARCRGKPGILISFNDAVIVLQ